MTSKSALTIFVTGVMCCAVSVVAVILTAKTFGPLPLSVSQTTTQKQGTFDVTGQSEVTVVPDNAELTLGLEVTKPKVAEAQIQVNQVISDLTTKLKTMGIDAKDIKTQNYSVNPNYDYTTGTQRTNGYRVSSSLRVNVKQFDQINGIIDTATAAGVTEIGNVQFTLSDEKEAEVKQQARKEAIDKAKNNASELSGLAGMKLGKIVNISELTPARPIMYESSKSAISLSAGGALDQATNIEAGSSSYTYTVTLSYETL
ncbi:MAG: SIMPL domain-containing protein [Patescibacteria group bacterium]